MDLGDRVNVSFTDCRFTVAMNKHKLNLLKGKAAMLSMFVLLYLLRELSFICMMPDVHIDVKANIYCRYLISPGHDGETNMVLMVKELCYVCG